MSWFSRLKEGLSKTSSGLSSGISDIFTKRKLDDEALEELEELLITADLGASNAAAIVAEFAQGRFDKEIEPETVKEALAALIAERLEPFSKPLELTATKPHVVLVVGVNGNGKTTTIGKLAAHYKAQGKQVMLCAADTFRAAAVEQLMRWAERSECAIVTGPEQSDPASVAYKALERAQNEGADLLLIDTAGRLYNKANLMQELEKIIRVLHKLNPEAPHSVLQVLDATTGQNALQQVEEFRKIANVSGLAVTKLDGTAKAGVIVALAQRFKLPIYAVGVGESIDDLRPFDATEFANGLLG
jgi:fused signal recognition particle receptor